MSGTLTIERAGPSMSVQDLGRPNHIAQGLSAGGAADRLALFEATALLGLPDVIPAIEMAGMGGVFSCDVPMRFALTGAPMRASIDERPISWNMTHLLLPNQRLTIGGALHGTYGYLTPAAGLVAPEWMGSISTHLVAGVGEALAAGDMLALKQDTDIAAPSQKLVPSARFSGGVIRMIAGPQTEFFSTETLARFQSTTFLRSAQANRQGLRLETSEPPFANIAPKGLASEFIMPGDIQMTGDGVPFVLLCECQTVGGYPRIGTVVAQDLPLVAQASAGANLRFEMVALEVADASAPNEAEQLRVLRTKVQPALRDPHDIADLLRYQLISGVTAGDDLERT
ncbi:biotin-dependent carboxyltransferase family protein [Falsihalocynthiibacter sp. S25ZX9]|uniref:5-oxoprolinase subunit C family protein n=1 Tax=Falsihalocynthiibacter sp. S25ZX9 TaxID=3240870 RepID=UPI00351047EF